MLTMFIDQSLLNFLTNVVMAVTGQRSFQHGVLLHATSAATLLVLPPALVALHGLLCLAARRVPAGASIIAAAPSHPG
jgi:hypothetical protein